MNRACFLWSLTMIMLYGQIYADEGHASFINAKSGAVGKLAWSKPLTEKAGAAKARIILTDGKIIIVEGMKKLFAFSQDGAALWQREKWSGTPVVLKEGMLYYTVASRKNEMQAIDMNNVVKIQGYEIPDVGEQSYLVLFEPFNEGLIAQVQYPDIPEQGGKAFIVYKTHKGGLLYDWGKQYDNEESPIHPVVCDGGRVLVTATQQDALTFDTEGKQREPQPYSRFPLPVGTSTTGVSCGGDRSLFWTGLEGRNTVLVATDLMGGEKWRWSSSARPPGAVMPPIVAREKVYLLSRKRLSAIEHGRLLWDFEAQKGTFSTGTALADGTILVVEGNRLRRLDQAGRIQFEVVVDGAIMTPPVIDSAGNIYLASEETLYAIH